MLSAYSGGYSAANPAEIVEKREMCRIVQYMIKKYLSERENAVIYYLFYREFTQTETARVMRVTQPTVHIYLQRALAKLKKRLCEMNLQD